MARTQCPRLGLAFGAAVALGALAACSRPAPSPPAAARGDSPAADPRDVVVGRGGGSGTTAPGDASADAATEAVRDAATADATATAEAEAGPASSPNVSSPEEFERLATPLVCARAVRCGTIGRSQLDDCLLGEGESRLNLVWGFRDLLRIDEIAAAGRLAIDLSRTGECLDLLRSGGCHLEIADVPPGCLGGAERVYHVPSVSPGAPCTRWGECIDGYCSADGMCEGKCLARVPGGAECETTGSHGLCTESDFCQDHVCTPRRREGESCPGHWQACAPGLWCKGWVPENDDPEWRRPEQPGICSRPEGVGASCATDRSDDICRADLFCDWNAEPPACRERLGEDDECGWLDACADGLACVGLRLGGINRYGRRMGVATAGRCSPHLDAGDACVPEDFVTGCPGSMTCDKTTKTCRSTCHEGDPCDSSWCPPDRPEGEECEPEGCCGGLYCDPRTRVCTRQLEAGERCRPTRFGVDDEPCFLGTCDPRRRVCDPGCRE
ncbi:MAG: hypothetical protein HY905_12965 [Deltaproteobacteria bacterium]|nr:hypothetical protein [Deltaproteobacteria bacterium]